MADADQDWIETQRRDLARLQALAMSLAERAHERALAAETPQEAEAPTRSFERLARSARQSMALRARLERELARAGDERRAEARKETQARIARRELRLANTLQEILWTEAERPDFKVDLELATGVVCHVGDYVDEPDFLTAPFEAQCRRIALDAGVRPGAVERFFARPEPLPGPSAPPPPDRDFWNSA
jgi:hypothetical protein